MPKRKAHPSETRDVIVIGASAGGVEPLRAIAAGLDPDLPAAVLVVLHLSSRHPSSLPEILSRAGPLPAVPAADGEPLRRGRIYVATPDRHLGVEPGLVRVTMGAHENRHRPAIDVLFRSAAAAYGPRVVGVVLSGALDDGTAGLIAVKMRGGIAIVQDPAQAFSADMPRNAMRYIEVDHKLPAEAIGPVVSQLSRTPVAIEAPPPSAEMEEETRIARLEIGPPGDEDERHPRSSIACPDCHGMLREIQEGSLLRFRCRTGHAYSPESLLEVEDEALEDALWQALRILEERVALQKRLVGHVRGRGLEALAAHFGSRLERTERNAETLRRVLATGRLETVPASEN